MTKSEAVTEFAKTVLPAVVAQFGRKDKPAVRTAWNDFVDALQKSGQITERQSETWQAPNFARLIADLQS
jgi:hypothetical protein